MTDRDRHDPNTVDRLLARIELMQAHHSEAITLAHHRAAQAERDNIALRQVNEQLRRRLATETGNAIDAEKHGYDRAMAEVNGKPIGSVDPGALRHDPALDVLVRLKQDIAALDAALLRR